MLRGIAGAAAALGLVTVAPGVAALGALAQAAALCEAEGLSDALFPLYCVCVDRDHLVGFDVALEGVAVLCGTAGHGWAEL